MEDDNCEEQRHLHNNSLNELNTEKQARLRILSQNRKDLQMQFARIKQTIEKVLDKNKYLAKRVLTFSWAGYYNYTSTYYLSMTFSTIVLTVTDVFGGGGSPAASGSPKDEGTLNKWMNRLADALKDLLWRPLNHYRLSWEVLLGLFYDFLAMILDF